MDIQTKKIMLYVFTVALIYIAYQEFYKAIFLNRSIVGATVFSLFACIGYSVTYLILTHDINKFEIWKKQAIVYTTKASGVISGLSLSSSQKMDEIPLSFPPNTRIM
jgi:predicted lactoylglutathione lyase